MDHRTDIYSFGVMLYRMVTGQLPIQGKSLGELVIKHLTVTPKRPITLCDIPKALDALIMQCLEKEPVRRPRAMSEILGRLEELMLELGAE